VGGEKLAMGKRGKEEGGEGQWREGIEGPVGGLSSCEEEVEC
jgi:hypothetical protein